MSTSYDLVIVGGGLAGCALGKVMAESGARVLVIERETAFRDRVRGEGMHPWGVAEARALGIYEPILERCGRELRWWDSYEGPNLHDRRNLIESTPHRAGELAFYHPEMQEVVLQLAEAAGAEVRRGVTVVESLPGPPPAVVTRSNGRTEWIGARLIVGADGRGSRVRVQARFPIRRAAERLVICGLLLAGETIPPDSVHWFPHPSNGQATILFPVGSGRIRAYFIYRKREGTRQPLSGPNQIAAFKTACLSSGAPEAWFAESRPLGPLAEFEGADVWADHPYRNGIVLIGDAAAASDPSFGCGLSLTLKDVRTLRDALLAQDNWDAAAHAYAEEHDRYYANLHRILDWATALLFDLGAEADARRQRAFSRPNSPKDVPDIVGLGPDSPCDEMARRRMFGEEME
jgi:2-polyprenyl-6-methoxyphenol hydroxylase-like FAD-dependent oxidoreductase